MAVQKWMIGKDLEAMTASLWNLLQVFFKQNVQYATYSSVTHTKLPVVALASVIHVVSEPKLPKTTAQYARKTTTKSLKTWA